MRELNGKEIIMRVIKFRAYSTDSNQWIYGFYREYPIYQKCGKCVDHINYFIDKIEGGSEFIKPETVGQFTGLLDKNGREIYEGDILNVGKEWDGNTGSIKVYNEIGIKNGCFGYIGEHSRELLPFCHHEVTEEIAGNIYDNPELLKGGSNER